MSRVKINFILDTVAVVLFIILVTTGFIVRYSLPPGSGHFFTVWGLDRHALGGVHFWVSVLFLGVMALHLYFHWGWVRRVCERLKDQWAFRAGLAGLIIVVFIAFLPLFAGVAEEGRDFTSSRAHELTSSRLFFEDMVLRGQRGYGRGFFRQYGRMTLDELAQETDLSVDTIKSRLNLPESLSADTRLRVLQQKYHLRGRDIRGLVSYSNDDWFDEYF